MFLGDHRSHFFGKLDALVHRYPGDRDKRHDVYRAHPLMFAAVLVKVNVLQGLVEEYVDSFFQTFAVAHQSEHRTVLGRVRRDVEQANAFDGAHSVRYLLHNVQPRPLADIGYALDNLLGHFDCSFMLD